MLVVKEVADLPGEIDVGPLIAPPDDVALPDLAPSQDGHDARTVILDIKPIPDVGSVTVDRDRLAVQAGMNHGGDELLDVLAGSVVVRAIRDCHRQPERPGVRHHQMI